jgi:nitrogen fixation/metabolism regulation signal transduction histidine kinase
VKVLANPVVLRAAVVFFCAGFAFLMGVVFIRMLRNSIAEEASISSEPKASLEHMPMHVFNTVIEQLKQQKSELKAQMQEEQLRARIAENFSQTVISNLPSGVLIVGPNGLVKHSNPAAKEILGFASLTGMSAENIFRGTIMSSPASAAVDDTSDENPGALTLDDAVRAALQKNGGGSRVEADYATPGDQYRHIAITVSPVFDADGSLLGAACVIDDRTELEQLRRQPISQSISAAAGAGSPS